MISVAWSVDYWAANSNMANKPGSLQQQNQQANPLNDALNGLLGGKKKK